MDYARIEGVIGHEYFHNWTGNRVTCRDWFQLTLKEGLTVFRDQVRKKPLQMPQIVFHTETASCLTRSLWSQKNWNSGSAAM